MSSARFDIRRPHRVHVVGVGGSGMSAIAEVLAAMGHLVTGSDLVASPAFERLRQSGLGVGLGHDPARVRSAEVLAVSSAVRPGNPELEEAKRLGIPVLSRAEVLAAICSTRRVLAVAGTHGKTTTSAMVVSVLEAAGLCPSYLVGGSVIGLGGGARLAASEWLVVEADESDGTFLSLPFEIGVVTSVEPDHLDYYGSFDALVAAFERFCGRAGAGRVVTCADDPVAARLTGEKGALTYGRAVGAAVRVEALRCERSGSSFRIVADGEDLGEFSLRVPGAHNALNAAGALAAGLLAGVGPGVAREGLARFRGVARRFEYRGRAGGVEFVDDYAHLPTEVRAALAAARTCGFSRVVCVFQPHRYSRTQALADSFADAFGGAEVVVVTDVYPAGEAPLAGVSGRLVADAIAKAAPDRPVYYVPDRGALASEVAALLRPGDLCLTLGAGDLTTLPDELARLVGAGS